MRLKAIWVFLVAVAAANWSVPVEGAQRLRVVTTLSTYADLAKTIGGAQVEVSAVASPKFNPHFIEPRPSDVLRVKRAELFIHSGLDLEAWRGPLLDAAANPAIMPGGTAELDLSQGIALLEVPNHPVSRSEGDIHLYGNPHYWTSPENGKVIAQQIADKLSAMQPEAAADFRKNLQAFLDRLNQKESEWRALIAPYKGQEVVGYHNEWPYFMEFLGLEMKEYLEPRPGIPPTPKHVEFIEAYIKSKQIRAIIQPTYFPGRTTDAIAQRTGARGATICQSVQELPACTDYVATLDYNVHQLVAALKGN